MSDRNRFMLDGQDVEAKTGETIWEVAKRNGTLIPHLCHKDAPGLHGRYRRRTRAGGALHPHAD